MFTSQGPVTAIRIILRNRTQATQICYVHTIKFDQHISHLVSIFVHLINLELVGTGVLGAIHSKLSRQNLQTNFFHANIK